MSRCRRKIPFSKDLRERSTYTEKLAWNILRDRRCHGFKFRRQYGISGFIIDFYCYELKLAVEIDGSSHFGREDYDHERQRILENEGITFIRISADALYESPETLVISILEYAATHSEFPSNSQSTTDLKLVADASSLPTHIHVSPSPACLERG